MKLTDFIKEIGEEITSEEFSICITQYNKDLKADTYIHDEYNYRPEFYKFLSKSLIMKKDKVHADETKAPITVSQSYVSELRLCTGAVAGTPCEHLIIRISNVDKNIEDVLEDFNKNYKDNPYFEQYKDIFNRYTEKLEEKER